MTLEEPRTLLITLNGRDRPGVTRSLFAALAGHDVAVVDVEQMVVRGHLMLTVLVRTDDSPESLRAAEAAARACAESLAMEIQTQTGADEDSERRRNRVHVTLMGSPLRPSAVEACAALIADRGGNIDRIRRIASYPVTALEFQGSGVSVEEIRRPLVDVAAQHGADVAVQEAGLDRRGQYLVVMDVDSTFIQDEVIDLLAEEAGALEAVARITERAMAGELDFEASLRERAALLAGLPAEALDRVRARITLTRGARTLVRTLNRLGYRIALVSGGFTEIIAPIAADLGVADVRANTLEIVDGVLTGRITGPVIDRLGKRTALEAFARQYAIPIRRTIAIGDGANDIDMLEAAGLGVAFNAKPAARAAAHAAVNVPYLDSVLFLMGITREEIESADARDGISHEESRKS
ncbi:MAG: phosphoserine phosphatase SerB [Candidatus Nanopelagicales bacterium]|nr:phosphoserine phosphatase SerB [Candidatus Nanopelagicales bacterium]MCF8556289.1 phosphoserine phosphatase SerB [Candidatus Nanopelagicales bacterium]